MWLAILLACATAPSPEPAAPRTPVDANVVRITGVAENGKLAAVVIASQGPIYILDRQEWPPDLVGKSVTVEGVIETTDDFAASVGPNGEISQGTAGGDQVMRRSTLISP